MIIFYFLKYDFDYLPTGNILYTTVARVTRLRPEFDYPDCVQTRIGSQNNVSYKLNLKQSSYKYTTGVAK